MGDCADDLTDDQLDLLAIHSAGMCGDWCPFCEEEDEEDE